MLDRKIVGWIGIALAPGIAMAAIEEGVGQIVSSSGASVNGTAVPNQGTIMPGNILATGLDGRAVVDFAGGNQVNVLENSSVSFKFVSGNVHAQMSSGIVAARSLGRDMVIVETPAYRVEPAQQSKAVYVVAILTDKTTVVSDQTGKVSITQLSSGKRYVLDQGHYAELAAASPVSAPSSPDQQSGAEPNSETPPGILTSPTGRFILAVGAGAGVGVGIWLGRTVLAPGPQSPSAP